MSLHIHPILRAREEALKAAGLFVTLDSVGFQCVKNLENAGGTFRQAPKVTYLFNGTSYVATSIPLGS